MNHSFDMQIAIDYDIETAVFLNNLAFWTQKNVANKVHFYDDHYWTYNSYEAFVELFPYWSIETVRRIIRNAIRDGLIIKGNYNKKRYDNTNWYALTQKALAYYPMLLGQVLNTPVGSNKTPVETNRPIPDSKPDIVDTSACGAQVVDSDSSISPLELVSVFVNELPDSPGPRIHAKHGHLEEEEKKAIRKFKEHFESKNKHLLTVDYFRKYLRKLKRECPGFIYNEYIHKESGALLRNGFLQIVNWGNYEKFIRKQLK